VGYIAVGLGLALAAAGIWTEDVSGIVAGVLLILVGAACLIRAEIGSTRRARRQFDALLALYPEGDVRHFGRLAM
jgi:hypothetical protein